MDSSGRTTSSDGNFGRGNCLEAEMNEVKWLERWPNKERELKMNIAVLAVLLLVTLAALMYAAHQCEQANNRAKYWQEQFFLKTK
jgi:hypothetical protein